MILPLFWANTFTGYLGNAVNEPSLERPALLAVLNTLLSFCLFLHLLIIHFWRSSLSLQFFFFFLSLLPLRVVHELWITLSWNIWYSEATWKANDPCGEKWAYYNNKERLCRTEAWFLGFYWTSRLDPNSHYSSVFPLHLYFFLPAPSAPHAVY